VQAKLAPIRSNRDGHPRSGEPLDLSIAHCGGTGEGGICQRSSHLPLQQDSAPKRDRRLLWKESVKPTARLQGQIKCRVG
jgi:hypothetical protein